MTRKINSLTKTMAVIVSLCWVLLLYWRGLDSFLILDDAPNLQNLQHIEHWFDANFWHFVTSGTSSVTGRPLALLSFAFQFDRWPKDISGLKQVNLWVHIANTFLVLLLLFQLFKYIGSSRKLAASGFWLALFIALFWAIHPIHVNAVLYLIQRMTLLSSTFILLAINALLLAQLTWDKQRNLSLSCLLLATGLLPLLGLLCKETGALAYPYMAVVTFFCYRIGADCSLSKIPIAYLRLLVYFPSALLLGYLIFGYAHWSHYYAIRDFDLIERLMTQARVVWHYVYSILLPAPSHFTLIGHDAYGISRGLLQPWTTLLAILAWVGAAFGVFCLNRYKSKLFIPVGFCFGWFLCGNLLESTTIPLEIRFEHRVYLASLGVLVGSALALFALQQRVSFSKHLLAVCCCLFFCFFMFVSMSGVSLWRNSIYMAQATIIEHPESQRAQEYLLGEIEKFQGVEELSAAFRLRNKNLGYSSMIELVKLKFMCKHQAWFELSPDLFSEFATVWSDRTVITFFSSLLEIHLEHTCPILDEHFMRELLEAAARNPHFKSRAYEIDYYLATYWSHHNNQQKFAFHWEKSVADRPEFATYLLAAANQLKQLNFIRMYDYLDQAQGMMKESFPDPNQVDLLQNMLRVAEKKREEIYESEL